MVVHSCVNGKMNGPSYKTTHREITADIVCLSQPRYVPAALLHESDGAFFFFFFFPVVPLSVCVNPQCLWLVVLPAHFLPSRVSLPCVDMSQVDGKTTQIVK